MRRAALYLSLALVLTVVVRLFVAEPFIVSGGSMKPLLLPRDYLIVDKWHYRSAAPVRGDVVVFRYPLDPDQVFVKRIIGLPGETVEIASGTVRIARPGGATTTLAEPYRTSDMNPEREERITLHDDEYFVLGDNRTGSADSRAWGPLQERFIIGRAFARLFPLSRAALDPAAHRYDTDIHTE